MTKAIWSGAVSFGLVSIPIELIPAMRDHSIHLHMLTGDGQCRLARANPFPLGDQGQVFGLTACSYISSIE